MCQLGKSGMFLMRVIWKVGMKWATIEEEEGANILLKYVCCVMWRLHIQIRTLFAVFASFRRRYTLFKLIYNL